MINNDFTAVCAPTESVLSETFSQPSTQLSAAIHLNRILEGAVISTASVKEEMALSGKAWKKIREGLGAIL